MQMAVVPALGARFAIPLGNVLPPVHEQMVVGLLGDPVAVPQTPLIVLPLVSNTVPVVIHLLPAEDPLVSAPPPALAPPQDVPLLPPPAPGKHSPVVLEYVALRSPPVDLQAVPVPVMVDNPAQEALLPMGVAHALGAKRVQTARVSLLATTPPPAHP